MNSNGKIRRQEKGFTLLEVLIVIGILVILTVGSIPSIQSWTGRQIRDRWSIEAMDALRRAESRSTSGQNDNAHGVHFETSLFSLFEGASYNAADPENEDANLPNGITISAITLTGGGADVIFDKNTGETTTDGTVTFLFTDGTTTILDINKLGLVFIQ